jgi:hypothetical protein
VGHFSESRPEVIIYYGANEILPKRATNNGTASSKVLSDGLLPLYDKIFATNFRVNPIIKQIHFSNYYHFKDFNQSILLANCDVAQVTESELTMTLPSSHNLFCNVGNK